MTSKTCVFPGFARRFQFNFFWLLNLIIDVRVQEQPVLPETVGGGQPNLAVGAEDPRSTAAVPPQPLVSNVTTNFTCLFFRLVLCFDPCLLLSQAKKIVTSRIHKLRHQTKTTKQPFYSAAPDSVLT